jgi:hypothetical protein
MAVALVVARALAKGVAVLALARPSGLSLGQAVWLAVGLTPMSAPAWVMMLDFVSRHPTVGAQLMPVMLASLALLELAAPLAVMGALRGAGEVDAQPARRETNP